MTEPSSTRPTSSFADLPVTPAEHFKLYFYAAVLNAIQQIGHSFGAEEKIYAEFPFLQGYAAQLERRGVVLVDARSLARWFAAVEAWESTCEAHLPLRALRVAASLDHPALALLITAGLAEEDPRFGGLFATLQGRADSPAPTAGLLNAWWHGVTVRSLQLPGLLQMTAAAGPRHLWPVQVPALIWDALRGEPALWTNDGLELQPTGTVAPALLLPDAVRATLGALPPLADTGEINAIVVRGPQHNGRTTALRWLAHQEGRGLLLARRFTKADDERWNLLGPLATLLNAMPVAALDLGPNENFEVPRLRAYRGALGLTLGRTGGLTGPGVARAVSFELPIPGVGLRRQIWGGVLPMASDATRAELSGRFRLASGHLYRLAPLAAAQAALAGRPEATPADVQTASRLMNRQALDALAQHVSAGGTWDDLAVGELTRGELLNLERRCRQREALAASLGPTARLGATAGVRALLSGPSGTGKTLAARILAGALGLDLYRIDLASVVNKYIGETEKNLDRIFSRAEELDIVLLLDEGDALLTQRTAVQTSNDRYANLETNYLLQRLEQFEGILLVTTNAGERIDQAFQRRMDIVVEFGPPDAGDRRRIWQMHLPGEHDLDHPLLEKVSARCLFTGGQIRNAVQHAGLLALENGGRITPAYLVAAIEREYRKLGAASPLRPAGLPRLDETSPRN